MLTKRTDTDKVSIEWDLTCTSAMAISLLSQSTESMIRPWFLSKTDVKGVIMGKRFILWPNTVVAGILETLIIGKIIPDGKQAHLSATVRLVPPYNLFPINQAVNWISGVLMVISWLLIVAGVVFDKELLTKIFVPLFLLTGILNLIQFTKYVVKPELTDLCKYLNNIFSKYRIQ